MWKSEFVGRVWGCEDDLGEYNGQTCKVLRVGNDTNKGPDFVTKNHFSLKQGTPCTPLRTSVKIVLTPPPHDTVDHPSPVPTTVICGTLRVLSLGDGFLNRPSFADVTVSTLRDWISC